MQRVIGGKVYATDTATFLGDWDNGHFGSDFEYCHEALYRTAKGAYLLYGEGGARSIYATRRGNDMTGGEQLHLLTEEAARAWAEEHLTGEEYETIFPVEEG